MKKLFLLFFLITMAPICSAADVPDDLAAQLGAILAVSPPTGDGVPTVKDVGRTTPPFVAEASSTSDSSSSDDDSDSSSDDEDADWDREVEGGMFEVSPERKKKAPRPDRHFFAAHFMSCFVLDAPELLVNAEAIDACLQAFAQNKASYEQQMFLAGIITSKLAGSKAECRRDALTCAQTLQIVLPHNRGLQLAITELEVIMSDARRARGAATSARLLKALHGI